MSSPLVRVLLALSFVLVSGVFRTAAAQPAVELKLLIWEDYIAPEVLEDFHRETGIAVRQVVFTDDSERDKLLVANDGRDYDIACLNHAVISSYVASGWLAPVTLAEMPNLANIESRWFDRVPAAHGYAVPYFWGVTGIVYRRDLAGAEMRSWQQLLDPAPALEHRVAMIASKRDLIGAALKALGYSINSTALAELAAAEALLLKQRPAVVSYEYDLAAEREKSGLYKGKVAAAIAFNGDADLLRQIKPEVEFVIPQEGGILWLDFLAVLAQSPHKAAAISLLNFLNRPEHAARNAAHVHFASPNHAALQHLPADFLANHTIFPTTEEVNRSEFEAEVPPRIQKRINEIAARIMR